MDPHTGRYALSGVCVSRITESGSDLQYGARPLRRAIQRMVEDALSEEILTGHIKLGDRVRASEQDEKLVFLPEPEPEPEPELV